MLSERPTDTCPGVLAVGADPVPPGGSVLHRAHSTYATQIGSPGKSKEHGTVCCASLPEFESAAAAQTVASNAAGEMFPEIALGPARHWNSA